MLRDRLIPLSSHECDRAYPGRTAREGQRSGGSARSGYLPDPLDHLRLGRSGARQ